MNRPTLVAHARASIARGSRSFALASRLFDRTTRERAWLLYAWCRRCDDLADGQALGHAMAAPADPAARIATIRALTARALAGEETGDPAFDALGVVAGECALPHALIEEHIAGFALDAEGWSPETEDDLLRYCWHVAGAVGVMMALAMGVPPGDRDTLDRAADLGIAFQLANIARDIGEDWANERCYLPAEWLAQAGLRRARMMDAEHREALADVALRLTSLAARHEASARRGTPALPFRAAWAVLAAAGIYGEIAREVAARGAAAIGTRVVVGRRAKADWMIRGWYQARQRARLFPREPRPSDLWRRPRLGGVDGMAPIHQIRSP